MPRFPLLVFAAITAITLQQSPSSRPTGRVILTLPDSGAWDPVATADGKRIYYPTSKSGLMMFDRDRKTSSVVLKAEVFEVTVSRSGNALAFVRYTEDGNKQHIWMLPLNARSGLAAGEARRVTLAQGEIPSLSPDGRSLAYARFDSSGVNSNGVSLSVVPVTGGADRILARHEGVGIMPIRWSPDGAWIYYGVGPYRPTASGSYATMRVRTTGAPAPVVVQSRTSSGLFRNWPGLSPDGKLIAVRSDSLRMMISDVSGKFIGELALPSNPAPTEWSGPNSLLRLSRQAPRRVAQLVNLANGKTSTLSIPATDVYYPAWSPDGRQISFLHYLPAGSATDSEILVMNADGSGLRQIPVRRRPGIQVWSPDSRWIAYRSGTGFQSVISAVEVATGRDVALHPPGLTINFPVWRSDSRGVFVTLVLDSLNAPADRRIQVRDALLTGENRLHLEVHSMCNCLRVLNDTTYLINRQTIVGPWELIYRNDPDKGRKILDPFVGTTSLPVLSSDKQWLVFKRETNANASGQIATDAGLRTIDILRIDGSSRVIIDLPFVITGASRPVLLNGATQLLFVGHSAGGDSSSVYRTELATKAMQRIFTMPKVRTTGTLPMFDQALSPDGRFLVYMTEAAATTSITEFDISALVKRGTQRE